jgi:cation diffusion facilitator family transporter
MDKNKTAENKDKKLAAILSLTVGFLLLCFKFYAYHLTNSQSIFSDALESIVNVVAAIITLIVIIVASAPADNEHPYGHGKIESMASTFEGGAILFAGILIIIQAVQIFFHGAKVSEIDTGLLIVIGAGFANGLLGTFLYLRGKKFSSEALKASGIHLFTDTLTSVGIVVGLLAVKFTNLDWIDPIVAGLFGALLIYAGGKILMRSGNILIDGHDKKTLKIIAKLFQKHYVPGVIHIHYTRVIRSGSHHHIDCHMVIPEFWSILEAHEFSDQFEEKIINDYPVSGELHVHLDPCRKAYCDSCELANCPIRLSPFLKRKEINFAELTSPTQKSIVLP